MSVVEQCDQQWEQQWASGTTSSQKKRLQETHSGIVVHKRNPFDTGGPHFAMYYLHTIDTT